MDSSLLRTPSYYGQKLKSQQSRELIPAMIADYLYHTEQIMVLQLSNIMGVEAI